MAVCWRLFITFLWVSAVLSLLVGVASGVIAGRELTFFVRHMRKCTHVVDEMHDAMRDAEDAIAREDTESANVARHVVESRTAPAVMFCAQALPHLTPVIALVMVACGTLVITTFLVVVGLAIRRGAQPPSSKPKHS